jgi:magnesium transporter
MKVFFLDEHGLKPLSSPDLPALLEADAPGAIWVDMVGPTADDVAVMRDVFHFHPLAIEDTLNKRQRPKIEEYDHYLFLILNPAELHNSQVDIRELDVFIGPNFLVTVHHEDEPALTAAMQACSNRAGSGRTLTIGYVMYVLVDGVIDSYFPLLDELEEEIDAIAERVVERPDQHYLKRLLEVKRELAELWRIAGHQRDTFSLILREEHGIIRDDTLRYYLRDVFDHVLRVTDTINVLRDTVLSIVDLYFSSQSNRLNVVVQRLTFVTILIGALTVISGFYGMNFERNWPDFSTDGGVLFVLLLMAIAGVAVLFAAIRAEK